MIQCLASQTLSLIYSPGAMSRVGHCGHSENFIVDWSREWGWDKGEATQGLHVVAFMCRVVEMEQYKQKKRQTRRNTRGKLGAAPNIQHVIRNLLLGEPCFLFILWWFKLINHHQLEEMHDWLMKLLSIQG